MSNVWLIDIRFQGRIKMLSVTQFQWLVWNRNRNRNRLAMILII